MAVGSVFFCVFLQTTSAAHETDVQQREGLKLWWFESIGGVSRLPTSCVFSAEQMMGGDNTGVPEDPMMVPEGYVPAEVVPTGNTWCR